MIIDNTLKTLAYLVACLETAGKQTTAYERAKTVTEDVVNQMPLTAGDWTKTFLISHYFVFYVVESWLPDNTSELIGKALDKAKAYAVTTFEKAQFPERFTPAYMPYDTAADLEESLSMSYSTAKPLSGKTDEKSDLLLSSDQENRATVRGEVSLAEVYNKPIVNN